MNSPFKRGCTLLLLYLTISFFPSCQKAFLEKEKEASISKTTIGGSLGIKFSDIMYRLPQTEMYTIGNDIAFYTGRYESFTTDSSLIVRIPTTEDNNHFIYAERLSRDPENLKVYAVQFLPESGSTMSNYTGKLVWFDFQDGYIHGTDYKNGLPSGSLDPYKLAEPGWEQCMLDQGYFSLDGNGKLKVDEPPTINGMPQYGCPGLGGDGGGFFKKLGELLKTLLDGIPSGDGGSGYWWNWSLGGGGGSSTGAGVGGNNGGGTGTGGGWSSNGTVGGGPALVNDGLGESNGVTPNTNSDITMLANTWNLNQNQVNFLVFHPGMVPGLMLYHLTPFPPLTGTQKVNNVKEHIDMMITDPNYLDAINNHTGNWWDQDNNGVMFNKSKIFELYLQANPNGGLDCAELNAMPAMTQEIASYQVPQSVINHINTIINNNTSIYNTNSFHLQLIQNAYGGTVNCDYFYVKIAGLPSQNGVQMTADQLLEYFRTHWNNFISPSVNVAFNPYVHYIAGSVNIDETALYNSSYESSLGTLIHISMLDDGTVIESAYSRNTSIQHYYFGASTMKSPLDYEHPVAGNRRWGIFQNGGYWYFYTVGVDRTNDYSSTIVNNMFNAAFNSADNLWHSVQQKMSQFVTNNGGSVVGVYEKISRPQWDDVKDFLQGKITRAQLKAILHCP